jgi:phosphoribosylaminoimidazolecarboxamide formyltransferase/IMP cyclohydrolase
MKRTALLSVYEKKGIADFGAKLAALGWDILASGGTAKELVAAGIPVQDVASIVRCDPILDHRDVTLSRELHAGLLARDTVEDRGELERLGMPWIDLVCVDLCPLRVEIRREGSTRESIIEKTDIGGSTMLRSAARAGRIVISDPADRQKVIGFLETGGVPPETIRALAAKAEATVAAYALDSARYQSEGAYDGMVGRRALECKYGENAWQQPASLYARDGDDPLALERFLLIAGKAPSYNNLCDLDRMLQTITHIAAVFETSSGTVPRIAVGVKHGNPCGAAVGEDEIEVLEKMLGGNPRAIFGGFVIANFDINAASAETLLSHGMPAGARRLLDGIVAPAFGSDAVSMLQRKGDKCRFLANAALEAIGKESLDRAPRFRCVRGGFLRQPNYVFVLDIRDPTMEKLGSPTAVQENDLLLAWAIGSTSNSNTVTLVKNGMLIGNGVGQQDRVGASELAVTIARMHHDPKGAVAYSDSFFPFPDGPAILADAGIVSILTSSGSVRDGETKKLCAERGIALYLVPDEAGRGFFGH